MEAAPPDSMHPVRIVVADDLRRSRLTVFFRLFLAIPHFFWVGLIGSAAGVVVVVNWFAIVFAGHAIRDLQEFVAGYVRYVARVEAYVALAANPFPPFFLGTQMPPYPVDVEIDLPDRQSRSKAIFRLFLGLPALFLAGAFTGGIGGTGPRYFSTGVLGTAAFLVWFYALARGHAPRGLRDATVWALGYSTQTAAYLFLVTDRYPYAGPWPHVARILAPPSARPVPPPPVRVVVAGDLHRSRLMVFFRLPLAAPHLVWSLLWAVVADVVAVLNWFATLALGRSPRPFARFLAAALRYQTHLQAYLTLVGGPFPGFVGRAGSYPVDAAVDPFGRQRRVVTLFRLPLAIPAFFVSAAFGGVMFLVAIFGWFASLFTGRMPQNLRDAGAFAIAYSAQLSAYLFVLSDRYPYASPVLPEAA